jgi:hypothetical protein
MIKLLAITNEVSQVLQKKDLNIVHAAELVSDVEDGFAYMRESGCEIKFDEVQQFCMHNGIPVPHRAEEKYRFKVISGLNLSSQTISFVLFFVVRCRPNLMLEVCIH